LKTRRDKVFLVTKVWANDAAAARESFEKSVATLGVDAVDLLHLHSAGDKDIDKVLGAGGSWEELLRLKKAGKTRFIGLTGHSRPANFVRVIEESKTVDAMMVAMNFVDYHIYGFEEKVLPVARKHGVGVMAMKVFGGIQGGFSNYRQKKPHPSQLPKKFHLDSIRYEKSLEGVTGMVIGVHSAEQLRENIKLVLEAKPLAKEELAALRERGKEIAAGWEPRFGPVA
jgi:predicted aldo/keto reductase-like oxidoreductase